MFSCYCCCICCWLPLAGVLIDFPFLNFTNRCNYDSRLCNLWLEFKQSHGWFDSASGLLHNVKITGLNEFRLDILHDFFLHYDSRHKLWSRISMSIICIVSHLSGQSRRTRIENVGTWTLHIAVQIYLTLKSIDRMTQDMHIAPAFLCTCQWNKLREGKEKDRTVNVCCLACSLLTYGFMNKDVLI